MLNCIANIGKGFSPATGGGVVTPAAPVITAITEASGIVTLTVTQAASIAVTIYSRVAGAASWTLRAASQAVANPIAIAGLTAGTTYEFYAVAISDGTSSAPSNIKTIYLHNSALPTTSEIELAAAGVVAALGVFKTTGVWNWQIAADKLGSAVYDAICPFCFIGEVPTSPGREGGMALNRKIRLTAMIGQKSMTDGVARTGDATTVGVAELRALVIAALDKWHPGAGFDCDEFYVADEEEIYKDARKYAVEVSFEANRIIN